MNRFSRFIDDERATLRIEIKDAVGTGIAGGIVAGILWGVFEGFLILTRQEGLRSAGLQLIMTSVVFNATITLIAAAFLNVFLFPLLARDEPERFELTTRSAVLWLCLYTAGFLLYIERPLLPDPAKYGIVGYLITGVLLIGILVVTRWVFSLISRVTLFVLKPLSHVVRRVLFSCFVIALLSSYLGYAAIWFRGRLSTEARGTGPNVLLIIIDTVRADHLSLYGYERRTSPYLEKLAEEGVAFSQAICQYPSSLGSHASLFTSLYPLSHCTYEHVPSSRLSEDFTTLAEYFDNAGYRTVGILDNPWLARRFGFIQGYDTYVNGRKFELINHTNLRLMMETFFLKKLCGEFSERMEPSTRYAISTLREIQDEKFFMFLHYLNPHRPYLPPEPYNKLFQDGEKTKVETGGLQQSLFKMAKQGKIQITDKLAPQLTALYDGDIAYTDRQVGIILNELESLGLAGNTLVVVAADHGENLLNEAPYFVGHGGLTEGGIHVPLVMRYPPQGWNHTMINRVVELIDVMPTILEVAGIPADSRLEGKSLLPLLEGESAWEDVAFVQLHGRDYAVRTPDWKLIIKTNHDDEEGELTLFDVSRGTDTPASQLAVTQGVTDSLFALYKSWKADLECLSEPTQTEDTFDADTYEKLKSLGYLQ